MCDTVHIHHFVLLPSAANANQSKPKKAVRELSEEEEEEERPVKKSPAKKPRQRAAPARRRKQNSSEEEEEEWEDEKKTRRPRAASQRTRKYSKTVGGSFCIPPTVFILSWIWLPVLSWEVSLWRAFSYSSFGSLNSNPVCGYELPGSRSTIMIGTRQSLQFKTLYFGTSLYHQ